MRKNDTRVLEIIRNTALASNTKPITGEITDASTLDELGFDSLSKVELLMELEEQFSVTVDDADVVNVVNVGDLLNMIERLVV